ncbi:hypothetical protein COT64_02130 [Candidatus Shapirobacteria bacterium CG09_land_8_20_14_0_10_39_12]|uniref:Mur ligase central domain-containing protein n=1 Tax=Candidatus Shapirobacteria bacterium CG09_land_8_20_14_0_10_39_12 TaxID=1974885 RepID=A0A2H0WPF0_9BACT|nr:MAG: hypothetical protein COT64_02130 [Candidatus Shapirobacteria bacterium CG09_land_8_20_14_0_10_39_12]
MKKYFHLIRRKLAKIWLEINLQLTVVGVTGSYGKTSAVNAITKVLSAKYSVNKTDDNLDTVYNLPITILKTKIWNEVLVMEYGIDRLGEMAKHLDLVKPKISLLTGVTSVHTDEEHLQSLEKVISEKRKLVEAILDDGLAVFNYDDATVRKIGEEFTKRKIFYGLNKKADVWADKINLSLDKTEFVLHDKEAEILIKTGLLGFPAVYSCLAGYVVGKELGVKNEKIIEKLKELKPLAGRFSLEKGPLGTVLINDSRRANVASTLVGLKSISLFQGRKVAVLGEMGEIGEKAEELHRQIGDQASKLPIDVVVGVGPLAKFAVLDQNFWAKDVEEAAGILKKVLKKGDLLYLKASLLRHLERVIMLLNGEKVDCKEVVCHHYSSCNTCPNLLKKVK